MRILQAAGWYLPTSLGGTEVYVSALSAWLASRGDEVLVTAPEAGAAGPRRYAHDGIEVFRYPIPAEPTRDEARGDAVARGAGHLHDRLADWRPDVVHAHTFVTGLGVLELEAARAAGAKVVVTSHSASLGYTCQRGTMLRDGRALCDGLAEPVKCAACALLQRGVPAGLAASLARTPLPIARAARAWPGRTGTAVAMPALIEANRARQARLFATIDRFVVLSCWAADVLRMNGAPGAKVMVNRLGVAPRSGGWPPASRPGGPPLVCGVVARPEPIKGIADAVLAVAGLPPGVAVTLRVVAGASSAAERAELDRCRGLAGGDPRIRFEPPVPPDDVPALLGSFDVLVCPSRAVEGGPTVALEAHAVGTPVVGTAIPALTEIVPPDAGALVPVGDWPALGALLAALAADPGLLAAWRAHLPAPRRFDEVCADYGALYDALVA
ncbi:MAG: glycosyltransferase [Vicinamibacterales bacterium]